MINAKRFADLVQVITSWSTDPNTQVGCVIVGPKYSEIRAYGFNCFPRGVQDKLTYRWERPEKYMWVEHAERNAIYSAARSGISTEGCHMHIPGFPCSDCARAIIQSGITDLYCAKPDFEAPRWGDHFRVAHAMLSEGGVVTHENF